MDFLNSKFIEDLKGGKLPPVEVKFSTESLVQIAVTTAITAIVVILVAQILKKI